MRRTVKTFSGDSRGNVGVVFALMSLGMFGIIGLAVDYGRAFSSMTRLRGALDAAVLASSNLSGDAQLTTAKAHFSANFKADGFAVGTTVPQFTRNATGGLDGKVTAFIDTTFSRPFGIDNIAVLALSSAKPTTNTAQTVTSTSQQVVHGSVPCIHVQDQNNTTFLMDSNSNLDLHNCEVYVRSNDSIAMRAMSNSNVTFKRIWVKGGVWSTGGIKIVDSPYVIKTDAAVVGDPYYAAINDVRSMINVGNCNNGNTDKAFNGGVVNPGTYCGNTSFNGVTFNKGLYIIADASGSKPGALKLTGKLNGEAGVSFYLAGNKAYIAQYNASEESVLKALNEGISQGLLFFEASNRGVTWDMKVASCNKQGWTGLVYLPSANITLDSLSEWKKLNIAILSNQLTMKSLSTVIDSYLWTPYGKTMPIYEADEVKTVTTTETVVTEQSKYLLK